MSLPFFLKVMQLHTLAAISVQCLNICDSIFMFLHFSRTGKNEITVKIALLLFHDPNGLRGKPVSTRPCAKMEIKQAHVISSSQGEKGGSGGGRLEGRAERKETMEDAMVTRMEDGERG